MLQLRQLDTINRLDYMVEKLIKRENWADYVKAFAIFSMIICHAGVGLKNPNLCMFIYSFHMPVFFLISGYFEKPNNQQTVKQKILINLKKFITPYVVFNFFGFTYCWYGMLNHPELNHYITASQIIPNGIVGILTFQLSQTDYSFLPNGVLWFLISLLECKMIFIVTDIVYSKSKLATVGLVFLYAFFAYVFITSRLELFVIGPTLLAIPFYYMGFLAKRYHVFERLNTTQSFFITIISFTILYNLYTLNGRPDVASVWFGKNIMLFYLNAVLGSIMCITFSKCLGDIPYLSYVGRNTLAVLCVHVFFVMVGKRVISIISFIPEYSFIYCFLVSLFSISWSLLTGAYIMKHWPWMLGKFKR